MSEKYTATLLMSEFVTHDVKRYLLSMPDDFSWKAGQGVELAINHPKWCDESRPFTPTSLDDDKVLEFTIKSYPEHEGVTQELHKLSPGTELLISQPFGTISYKGPGVFLAGGAGVTPFLAIFRELARQGNLDGHSLIFSNKTPDDVICDKELQYYLGKRCILTFTDADTRQYPQQRIDKAFIEKHVADFDQNFYLCGPPGFMDAVNEALTDLGADPQNLVFEK